LDGNIGNINVFYKIYVNYIVNHEKKENYGSFNCNRHRYLYWNLTAWQNSCDKTFCKSRNRGLIDDRYTRPVSVVKRIPYVGPVISSVGLVLDVQEIVENASPAGAAKIIAGRVINECTPPELLIAGKCIIGGIIASVYTGGNPLVLSSTISAARSVIRN